MASARVRVRVLVGIAGEMRYAELANERGTLREELFEMCRKIRDAGMTH